MYFIDDNLTVSNPIPDSSSAKNTRLKRRHGICTAKPTFDVIGALHVDVFNQSNYMLNGVTMKVRMTRSKDSFVLMVKSDVTWSFKVDIGKIRNLLSYDACSTIIHALISCRLDYCNSILYNVPKSKTDRLQRLQNQCVHILTKSPRREHITPVLKRKKTLAKNSR